MEFNEYMKVNFSGLILQPGLFYKWIPAIRFELGTNWQQHFGYPDSPYLQNVYKRAITLFEELHLLGDEIFVVADVNKFGGGRGKSNRLLFQKYIKNRTIRYKMKHWDMPYLVSEDNEKGLHRTHRFVLSCKRSDIDYKALLKAIVNKEMGISPAIQHDIYFINSKNKTIFQIYDDRGCDLLAVSADTIRPIYEDYNDWILNYDRAAIDEVFE